jgi:hypothetical protein
MPHQKSILWRAAWKPERRSGFAKHVPPTTIGSADNKRLAPVSIQWKRQHTSTRIGECNCYTTDLLEAFPSQRKLSEVNPYRTCSRYGRRAGYKRKKTFSSARRPSAWAYNRATPFLGDINIGTLSSRLGESQIWDSKIWSWAPRDSDLKMTALPKTAAIVNDRPFLSSERAPQINKAAIVWQ